MTTSLPLVMTAAGPQPTPPQALNAALIELVSSTNPGYTANLPGSLIEDVSSTCVGALVLLDQARVDSVNSITPLGSNPFVTTQQGQIYGTPQGQGSNSSVPVVFTGSAPGFVIQPGFTVGDGTHQYVIQDGGVIGADSQSAALFALCTVADVFAIPSGTVTQLVTSVPTGYTLTVTNPNTGIPAVGPQDITDYRTQVLQAGRAVAQGLTSFLRTQVEAVSGVQARLVSVRQVSGEWEIIVGGGDPYAVAYAISRAVFDYSNITGSTLSLIGATQANPGVLTTDLNHGFSDSQVIQVEGVVGMTNLNGNSYTITVVDEKSFSIGVNTSAFPAYISGGVITPNLRNETVSLNYYPDTYDVTFVIPPQQSVVIALTWNTKAQNFVSPTAVAQLGSAALVAYINSIPVGQPVNLYELQTTFQTSVAGVLPPGQLTRMEFSVAINGVPTAPETGTGIIAGDPESYFLTSSSQISIVQG